MVIPSMIAILSLNDQYGCNFFCTSAFVDGQPWNTWSERMLRCSLSGVATLITSAFMQSDISVHDYCIPGISLSLFVSWFCLDSKSAMNSYVSDLCSIMLYCWICNSILCSLSDRVATSFLKLLPMSCDLLPYWPHGLSSSGTFVSNGSMPETSLSVLLY